MYVKWSGKLDSVAKMYPTRLNGYENDKRLNFSDQFKAAVALEALRGDKTVHEIWPSGSSTQRRCARGNGKRFEGMAGVFSDKVKKG